MSQCVTPFAVVVRFTVRDGHEAEFDDLIARAAAGVRSHEPSTLVYAWHRLEDQPRQRISYGLWDDRAAMLIHAGHLHMRHFRTRASRCWSPPMVTTCSWPKARRPQTFKWFRVNCVRPVIVLDGGTAPVELTPCL
jgi:quinol monooxygenase YgiN